MSEHGARPVDAVAAREDDEDCGAQPQRRDCAQQPGCFAPVAAAVRPGYSSSAEEPPEYAYSRLGALVDVSSRYDTAAAARMEQLDFKVCRSSTASVVSKCGLPQSDSR